MRGGRGLCGLATALALAGCESVERVSGDVIDAVSALGTPAAEESEALADVGEATADRCAEAAAGPDLLLPPPETAPADTAQLDPRLSEPQAAPAPVPADEDLALLPEPGTPDPDAEPRRAPLERPASGGPAEPVPHIYMSLQPLGDTVAVVFAIDAARDNTPNDDPAIRIAPENNACNPQELARYTFPEDDAARPIFAEREAGRDVTAAVLPNYLAIEVSTAMLRRGLAGDPEETKPQNVCTRKLWEQLVRPAEG
ncbi:MAG: hypothetical protein ACFBSD_05505 [Paracoccaceae bacterium]